MLNAYFRICLRQLSHRRMPLSVCTASLRNNLHSGQIREALDVFGGSATFTSYPGMIYGDFKRILSSPKQSTILHTQTCNPWNQFAKERPRAFKRLHIYSWTRAHTFTVSHEQTLRLSGPRRFRCNHSHRIGTSELRNSMPLNLSPCVPAELTAKLGQGSQYISYTINISTLGSIFSPRTGKPGHIWILPEVRRRLGSRSLLKPHPLT